MNGVDRMREHRARLKRGYVTSLEKNEALTFRQRYTRKSIPIGTSLSIFYLALIYIAAAMPYLASHLDMPMIIIVSAFIIATLIATRQMRALENVVHFGSHYNFSANAKTNDILVNVLAAWPMLSDVRAYRLYHNAHHGRYGSEIDPCRQRFKRMGLSAIDLSTRSRLTLAVLRWLPGYVREYYRDVGSRKAQVRSFIAWHAVSLGLTSVVSFDYAMTIALVWSFGMFLVLPVLRSIAEVSEHDYDLGSSEFATTFNNIGFMDRWILHPAGDAWHILHHLYPAIPWWEQQSAHSYLMMNDDAYRQGRHRTSMLEERNSHA